MIMRRLLIVLVLSSLGLAASAQGKGGSYLIEKDIPYHQDAGEYAAERCRLDFYYPADVRDFPTVVWFHGGGLTGGSKEIPDGLKESGLGIVAVNYRLMPRASVQECIDDAAAAVAWAFREVASRGGSPERIFVAGHSAGGYLTDMVVLEKKWLEAYGIDADRIAGAFPYSAQKITHFNVRQAMGIGPLQPVIDETAPLYHIRKLPMPMVVLSADRELEMNGRYEEQAYFWRMMKLVGNDDVFLYEFDGYDHGGMYYPAHNVVKRYIRHIVAGTLPER